MGTACVVDLFCGAGGLTHGLVKEGLDVVAGVDSDASCRYAYEHNNQTAFIQRKIEDLRAGDIAALFAPGSIKVLVGCAPCQPFSTYTKNKSKGEKWRLLSVFADLVDTVDPDIVSMENVPSLRSFDSGRLYQAFVERMKRRYHLSEHLVYCPDYGIPQRRKRLVVFASRFGEIRLVPPTHSKDRHCTVQQIIGHLPPIPAGGVCPTDPLHRASALSELNLQRIRQSVPGGSWRDWDRRLLTGCHAKESGRTYPSVYGRMSWIEPAPTITTQCHGYGNGRFGHPEQDRAISLREAALLQTFPAEYEFVAPGDPWHFATIARHIGNAVPVDLGRAIARSIEQHVVEEKVSAPIDRFSSTL